MFERRLKFLLILPILMGVVLIARLYQVQILHGAEYRRQSEEALISPRLYLQPLRGRILDRFGKILASDEPAHDVSIHYGVLSMQRPYIRLYANRIRQSETEWRGVERADVEAEAERRIGEMWLNLEMASGIPLDQLRARRDSICKSIESMRDYLGAIRRDKGLAEPGERIHLREEEMFHPILHDVTPEVRTRIELTLSKIPFVRVEPSVRRIWSEDTSPICHVLGRMGEVSAQTIATDQMADDQLACYRVGDQAGVSGLERLGESMLRGRRGYEDRYLNGAVMSHAAAIDGLDVKLTLDLDLQRSVCDLLADAVKENPPSTGASCVIIDVDTREILALVSVPTFDLRALDQTYASLRDDAKTSPLRFRAVAEEYQPGSILKPVSLLAAMTNGLIKPSDRVFCDGQFIPGSKKWHCWTHWRSMPGHGDMNAEEALQHSCNVYFYSLGQKTGAKRLTDFFRKFILGPRWNMSAVHSTGLIEERFGLIPTREWIKTNRKREFGHADGRNYAIGQGEMQITPLQAANMFATLATGAYRDPTLVAMSNTAENEQNERPAIPVEGVTAEQWQVIRRGLYRCVNEDGGTAFKHAHMDNLIVCGKTGSAECVPRVVESRYTFDIDGNGTLVAADAPSEEAARESLKISSKPKRMSREPRKFWPPPDPSKGTIPTHAWFAGFAPLDRPRIALAVIIEYGGGGGNTGGPVAKKIFDLLMASPHDYLRPRSSPQIAAR
jgi:penicillin-binding protein 2